MTDTVTTATAMTDATTAHTHESMIAAARQLVPLLAEHARAAELARQPSDEVIRAAAELGLFDLMTPKVYGGAELDIDTFFEVGAILGEGDASAAWVLLFYIEHSWMFCQFPESFQRRLFEGRSHVLAPAMLSPSGAVEAADGGYTLNGRWQWGTGIVHCDWIMAGAFQRTAEGPNAALYALPRDQVTVDPTWNMDGMAGTGSHDMVIVDAFVPTDQRVAVADMVMGTAPGAALHDGPLFTTPMMPILSFAAGLPALGQARMAVREYADQLQNRYHQLTQEKQSENTARQVRLAQSAMDVDAAEALMRLVLDEVMTVRFRADEDQRTRWKTVVAHAVGLCQQAINRVCEAAGATAHNLDNPLQRARRDVNTLACHSVFDLDLRYQEFGRSLIGLSSEAKW